MISIFRTVWYIHVSFSVFAVINYVIMDVPVGTIDTSSRAWSCLLLRLWYFPSISNMCSANSCGLTGVRSICTVINIRPQRELTEQDTYVWFQQPLCQSKFSNIASDNLRDKHPAVPSYQQGLISFPPWISNNISVKAGMKSLMLSQISIAKPLNLRDASVISTHTL